MNENRLSVSAGAVLMLAVIYFFDGGILSALVPAVAVHEIGHAVILYLSGASVRRIAVDMQGFRLDYSGYIPPFYEAMAIIFGPLCGFIYAIAASIVGKRLGSNFLLLSSGISVILSLFNLLPVRPLDGGRLMVQCFGESKAVFALELLTSALVLSVGMLLALRGVGAGLAAAGLWLVGYLLRSVRSTAAREI